MPKGDNNKKGPRGKYDNVILPKDEMRKILEEQRAAAPTVIDRVTKRLVQEVEDRAEREKQRRINRKKDKTKTRAKNKNDFYD